MGLLDFLFKSKRQQEPVSTQYTVRDGKSVKVGPVFEAWTSSDLEKMLSVLNEKAHPIDRHFLLQGIVSITYRDRKNLKSRKRCKDVAQIHVAEFSGIAPALKSDMKMLPRVSTFQNYATILTEDGEFEEAIKVCQIALEYGLHDGTKSGFEGRIKRIEKKAAKA